MSKHGLPGFNTPLPRFLDLVLALPFGVIIGHQVSRGGTDLLLLLAAVLLTLVIAVRPVIGLYLMMALIPLEGITMINPDFTLIKGVGWVTLGAWFAGKVVRRESILGLSGYVIKPLLAFAIVAITSVAWADYRQAWLIQILSLLQWILLVLLVIDQITSWKRLNVLMFVLLPTGLISSGLGLYQSYVEGIRKSEGGVGASNAFAVTISALLPIALYYAVYGGGLRALVGWLYALMSFPTIIVTLSRSATLIAPFLLSIRTTKLSGRSRWLLIVLILLLAWATIPITSWERIVDDIKSIWLDPMAKHSPRILNWLAALRMFLDHPLLGVGYANYGPYFTFQYQFLMPEDYIFKVYGSPRSAHSAYLSVLADLGIIGLSIFIWLLVVASRNIKWAIARATEVGRKRERQLLISVAVSWICYLLFNFLFTVHTDKLFWVLIAVTEVARRLMETEMPMEPTGVAQQAHVLAATDIS